MKPLTRSGPADLSLRLAHIWIRNVVEELSRWGHGVLSPEPDSGGVAISGVANTRSCCADSITIEACARTFAARTSPGEHTVCISCHRLLPITQWASWTGPGATAVSHVLANYCPTRFRPVHLTGAQRRRHRAQQPWNRQRRRLPGLGQTTLRPRSVAALHASGLPDPDHAAAAAADGRHSQQVLLVGRAERKCLNVLSSLPRSPSPTRHLDALDGEALRITTPDTHGATWWEPELLIGDRRGLVAVTWHSPVDPAGEPVACASETHPQRLAGEHSPDTPVRSFTAGEACDVDPAGLALRCIPPRLIRDSLARSRPTRTLGDLWRQTLATSAVTPQVPQWLTAEDVENRLRNLLADLPAPRTPGFLTGRDS